MAAESEFASLGRDVRGPVEHVECFDAPAGCTRVRFTTDEVTSLCPITRQPDFNTVVIDYEPNERCVETKSLKRYLWTFRDKELFAESLAVAIADEIHSATAAHSVTVVVTQHVRGGIVTEVTAQRP